MRRPIAIRLDLVRAARVPVLALLLELPISPVAPLPSRELRAPLIRRSCG